MSFHGDSHADCAGAHRVIAHVRLPDELMGTALFGDNHANTYLTN